MSLRGIIDAIGQDNARTYWTLTLNQKTTAFVEEHLASRLLTYFPFLERRGLTEICLDGIADLDDFFFKVAVELTAEGWLNPSSDETMGVRSEPFGLELARAPRCLALPLGLLMAGVHANGLSRHEMWLARRSPAQKSFPGYLDTIAGGLIKSGQSVQACLWEEAWQEAGITERDVIRLDGGATYGYWSSTPAGIARGYVHIVDLELEPAFRPMSADRSYDAFSLVAAANVLALIDGGALIKPVSCLAIFDFLRRHGDLRGVEQEHSICAFLDKQMLSRAETPR